MRLRLLLTVAAACALGSCDSAAPPSANGGEGFGPASLHFFLSDSAGVYRASGYTGVHQLTPGDTATDDFWLLVRLGDGAEAEVEGDLVAVCHGDGALSYTLTAEGGPVWKLESRCEPYTQAGTWVRLDGGVRTDGGTFETAIALP